MPLNVYWQMYYQNDTLILCKFILHIAMPIQVCPSDNEKIPCYSVNVLFDSLRLEEQNQKRDRNVFTHSKIQKKRAIPKNLIGNVYLACIAPSPSHVFVDCTGQM